MTEAKPIRVLFLCLGNICRSPLAEGVFVDLARRRGVADRFRVDSCGTGGWHVGEPADERARAVAQKNGVELLSRARQLCCPEDAEAFDIVLAMDESNRRDAISAGLPPAKVRLLRSFEPGADGDLEVPDPYYGGADGFDRVYEMVAAACEGLLDHLLEDRRSA